MGYENEKWKRKQKTPMEFLWFKMKNKKRSKKKHTQRDTNVCITDYVRIILELVRNWWVGVAFHFPCENGRQDSTNWKLHVNKIVKRKKKKKKRKQNKRKRVKKTRLKAWSANKVKWLQMICHRIDHQNDGCSTF